MPKISAASSTTRGAEKPAQASPRSGASRRQGAAAPAGRSPPRSSVDGAGRRLVDVRRRAGRRSDPRRGRRDAGGGAGRVVELGAVAVVLDDRAPGAVVRVVVRLHDNESNT